jgi:hypothetical protein
VRVTHRVVFGTLAAIEHVLAVRLADQHGLIERANLAMRQHVAAVGRRVSTLCTRRVCQQLALYHVYHNFCLHASLRQPLSQPLPHGGSAKQWRPCTQRWPLA